MDILTEKIPPHSVEAETAVIGGMLVDSQTVEGVLSMLESTDFYKANNAVLFDTIKAMNSEGMPIDFVTVIERLKSNGTLAKLGGAGSITAMLESVSTTANIDHYAAIVKNHSIRRKIIKLCAESIEQAYSESSVNEIKDNIEKELLGYNESAQVEVREFESMKQEFETMLRMRQGRGYTFYNLGLSEFDKKIGHMLKGELWTIAGRPGAGKTTLMCKGAVNMSMTEKVLYLTAEMNEVEIFAKCIANLTATDTTFFRAEIQRLNINDLMFNVREVKRNLAFKRVSRFRYDQVQRMVTAYKPDVLYVDYLGRFTLPGKKDSRAAAFSDIVNGLKDIAQDNNILVVLGCQIGRAQEQRNSGKPQMSDLKETGGIEEASDGIIAIHTEMEGQTINQSTIHLLKNRNGMTLNVPCTFHKAVCNFKIIEATNDNM